jgi:hypothetical protein
MLIIPDKTAKWLPIDWVTGVRFQAGAGIVLIATTCRPCLGSSLVVKRPERDANYSPPSRAEIKNTLSFTPTHNVVLKPGYSFTFYFYYSLLPCVLKVFPRYEM